MNKTKSVRIDERYAIHDTEMLTISRELQNTRNQTRYDSCRAYRVASGYVISHRNLPEFYRYIYYSYIDTADGSPIAYLGKRVTVNGTDISHRSYVRIGRT